jgi:hypothetical protein
MRKINLYSLNPLCSPCSFMQKKLTTKKKNLDFAKNRTSEPKSESSHTIFLNSLNYLIFLYYHWKQNISNIQNLQRFKKQAHNLPKRGFKIPSICSCSRLAMQWENWRWMVGESTSGHARLQTFCSHRPRIPPTATTASPTLLSPPTAATGVDQEQVLRGGAVRTTT